MSVNSVNTDQFYGGQKGQNYYISQIFNNSNELLSDLKLKENSPNPLGSLVMISYGEVPNSNKYEDNLEVDKEYGNLNSSIWLKQLLTSQEITNEQKIIIVDNNSSVEQNWCYVFQTSSLGVSGEGVEFIDSFNIDTQSEALPTNDPEIVLDWWQNSFLEGVSNNKPMISDKHFFDVFYYYYKNIDNKAISMKLSQGIIGNFYLYKNGLPTEDFTPDKIYVSVYYIRNNKKYDETKPEWDNYFFLSKISGIYSPPEEITSINGFAYDAFTNKILLGDIATKENIVDVTNNSILIGENLKTINPNTKTKPEIALGAYNVPQTGSIFTIGDGTKTTPHNAFEIRQTENGYAIYLNHEKIHPLADDIKDLNQTVNNIKQIPFIASHFDSSNNLLDFSNLDTDQVYTKKGQWKTINPAIVDDLGTGIFLPEEQISLQIKTLQLGTETYFKGIAWYLIDVEQYGDFNWDKTETYYSECYTEETETKKEHTITILPKGYAAEKPEGAFESTINLFASHQYFLIITYISQENEKVSFGELLNFNDFTPTEINGVNTYTTLGIFKKFNQLCALGEIDQCSKIVDKKTELNSDGVNAETQIVQYNNNFYIVGQSVVVSESPYERTFVFPIEGPLNTRYSDDTLCWALVSETGKTTQLRSEIQKFWQPGDFRYKYVPGGNSHLVTTIFYGQIVSNADVIAIAGFEQDILNTKIVDSSNIDVIEPSAPDIYNSPTSTSLPENPKKAFITLILLNAHLIDTTNRSIQLTLQQQSTKFQQLTFTKSNDDVINYDYSTFGYYNSFATDRSTTAEQDFRLQMRGPALKPKDSPINNFVVPVYKITTGNRTESNIKQNLIISTHKYFLPSEVEAMGYRSFSAAGEGTEQYPFFEKHSLLDLLKNRGDSRKYYILCFRSPSESYGGWVAFSEYHAIQDLETSVIKLPKNYTECRNLFGLISIRDVYFVHNDLIYVVLNNVTTTPSMFCL